MLSNGHLTKKEKEAFIDLGYLSSLRGIDSTGLVTITKKKPKSPKISYEIDKNTHNPVVFFMQPDILATIRKPNVTCLMGHSRAAVFGAVNDANAHPYQEGRYIGMHNGVVRKYTPDKWIEDKYTDSRILYQEIEKKGLEPVLANLYGKDAYALTFINTDECTLNMVRNEERPLFFAETPGALYWASEAYMLRLALTRNEIEIKDITSLKEGWLFTYDFVTTKVYDKELDLTRQPVDLPKIEAFFPRKDNVIVLPGVTKYVPKQDATGYIKDWMGLNDPLPKSFLAPGANEESDDYPFLDDLKDISPNARYRIRSAEKKAEWIDVIDVMPLIKKGCFNCKAPSAIDDDLYWLAPSVHLCSECMELPVMTSVVKNAGGVIKGEYYDPNDRYSLYGF